MIISKWQETFLLYSLISYTVIPILSLSLETQTLINQRKYKAKTKSPSVVRFLSFFFFFFWSAFPVFGYTFSARITKGAFITRGESPSGVNLGEINLDVNTSTRRPRQNFSSARHCHGNCTARPKTIQLLYIHAEGDIYFHYNDWHLARRLGSHRARVSPWMRSVSVPRKRFYPSARRITFTKRRDTAH